MAERSDGAILPGLLPRHAADGAHHMNLNRLHAHLKHSIAAREVLGAEILDWKAKRSN